MYSTLFGVILLATIVVGIRFLADMALSRDSKRSMPIAVSCSPALNEANGRLRARHRISGYGQSTFEIDGGHGPAAISGGLQRGRIGAPAPAPEQP